VTVHFASNLQASKLKCHKMVNTRVAASLQHQAYISSTPRWHLHAIHDIKSCYTTDQSLLSIVCGMIGLASKSSHTIDQMQCRNIPCV